jgi:hypothetical protein
MSTAVIGATGRVGSQVVRGLLARGDAVAALVRDPGKARRAFGEPGGLDKLTLAYADVLPAATPGRQAQTPLPATGPYLISRYLPGGEFLLVRNPRFRDGTPRLSRPGTRTGSGSAWTSAPPRAPPRSPPARSTSCPTWGRTRPAPGTSRSTRISSGSTR